MALLIKNILDIIEQSAPQSLAESWDNVGLLVGDRERRVKHILVALDPTSMVLDEAAAIGADTVITHHPLIFRPVSAVDTSEPTGKIIEKALQNSISVIGCHTNLDNARNSVSKKLASVLGLTNLSPLLPTAPSNDTDTGSGCVGSYSEAMDSSRFIQQLLQKLDLETVSIAGKLPATIKKVALCGGSGSSFTAAAYKSGADIYITSEVKHDIARWVEERNFCILDGTHYATEQFAVRLLAELLQGAVKPADWNLQITETKTEKNPFWNIKRNEK